jgi:alpha-tubulin suppressor-like RCC1 family protein
VLTTALDPVPELIALAGGSAHTCGLAADGRVFCWGNDGAGQLGDGDPFANQHAPVAVALTGLPGAASFISVTAGSGASSCMLSVEGVPYCWGADATGRIGNGAPAGNFTTPQAVDLATVTGQLPFVGLWTGGAHACGVAADGRSYCWGADGGGRLGNGAALTADQPSPSAVVTSGMAGSQAFVSMTQGGPHSCGVAADGVAYCWGNNLNGWLGTGNGPGDEETPALVDVSGL